MADDTLDPTPDLTALEAECRLLWDETGIHRFDPDGDGEIFSVDTPPPYVSAAHLHVGHAMSYSQAEFVVRYQRMNGRRVFYPMGFDDNGLPTERFVERERGVDKRTTSRAAFRAICLEETRRGAVTYTELWQALGLSVDWSLSYSTIDAHCRATAQRSFIDLHAKDRIYRAEEPVLWDPSAETALAQADVELISRRGILNELAFDGPDGPLWIATTRPELLPACVALYRHPDDPRYAHLQGATARTPLFGHEVPILADPEVKPDFGTGLMMVCTFGDAEDVRRWRRDKLPLRPCIGPDGKLGDLAGDWAGQAPETARKGIVKALIEAGLHRGTRQLEHVVPTSERTGAAVEFRLVPQWFVRVLDLKPALLARSAELDWHPAWMKPRLDDWIRGLQWDWNISRQRFYGVPMPVWLCDDCGEAVLARLEDLPVDPLEDAPPVGACPRCGGALRGDPDVMDTWMTSSLTPLVHANQAGTPGRKAAPTPMTVRVQAFEIIRTWLFYTLLKSHLHEDALPWRDVMISGWGLNEQGRKISKRDLEQGPPGGPADGEAFNRYEPDAVIRKYGADALRWWAASSHLGHDARYHEKDVRAGRKLAIKLWNAARLGQMIGIRDGAAPPREERPPEDRWLLAGLDATIRTVRRGFDAYDYAVGRDALDRFFWMTFCDDWLEFAKDRMQRPERYPPGSAEAASATFREAFRTLLGLFAPYVPFVTEALWQRLYRASEGGVSLHVTRFPEPSGIATNVQEMAPILDLVRAVRARKTELRIPQTRGLTRLTARCPDPALAILRSNDATVRACTRADEVSFAAGDALDVDFVAAERPD